MKKKVKAILYAHQVVQMPKEMERKKNIILATTIISTLFFDVLSFAIKGAQLALSAGLNWIALGFMLFYFIRQVLRNTVQTFTDAEKNSFSSLSDAYITTNVSEISNVVRGKVFRKTEDYSLIMTNAEVIFNLKEYIGYVWNYWQNIPVAIVNTISAVIMAVAILFTEFLQTGNIRLTLTFSAILLSCIVIFSILFKFRLKVRNAFREGRRILRKENEVLMNDLRNIEPLIKEEFSYRVDLVKDNLVKSRALERKETFKLNWLQILRSLVLAIFMVLIIVIKLYYAGGIEKLDLIILTDILAVSTVYSNILDKVASILHEFEGITNTLRDAERVKEDVDNIMDVYYTECNIEYANLEEIDHITVMPLEFAYPGARTLYKLRNLKRFVLERGKAYMVFGHTGCGKSTFMHLLIGKIKMALSPISYGTKSQTAYLSSIMHETNGRLGSNPVLQEIIFNKDGTQVDRPRLIDILHGTYIYDDILRNLGLIGENDEEVLEYLNSTTIEQYSSGQKQRLAIVKVLYNLAPEHQIVVFDEATNALDDKTALSVLQFMADYCQKDMKRIVLFVSHQVDLVRQVTDGSMTFESKSFPVYDVIVKD